MKYEIDFIATKENKGNADTICFCYEKDGKFINFILKMSIPLRLII